MLKTCPHCNKPIAGVASRNQTDDLRKLGIEFFKNLMVDDDGYDYALIGLHTKKPFGNSGVISDILEIIEWPPEGEGEYTVEQCEYADSLLKEKLIIFLRERCLPFLETMCSDR